MDNRQIRDELDKYSTEHLDFLISQWVHSERDRAVLRRRILDDITFETLAEEFGLSVRRTKSIVYNGQQKIFRHISG